MMKTKLTLFVSVLAFCFQQGYAQEKKKIKYRNSLGHSYAVEKSRDVVYTMDRVVEAVSSKVTTLNLRVGRPAK